ncbi:MAG TPA: hypothetical protein VGJ73_21190 [Verrucomicrobiae bacterium]
MALQYGRCKFMDQAKIFVPSGIIFSTEGRVTGVFHNSDHAADMAIENVLDFQLSGILSSGLLPEMKIKRA